MKGVTAALCILASAAFAVPARAQTASEAATATELFNAGRDLMREGRFAEACPKLAESARIDAKVGTLGKLAECDEKTGHLADAYAHWQQALNLARVAHDDREPRVREELARLETVVPRVRLTSAGHEPDLSVRLDSLEVSAAALDVPFAIDPGTHTVTVTAKGKKPWSSTFTAKADGKTSTVAIPALEVAPEEAPPKENATGGPLRTAAIVSGAAGIVALGIGTAFGFSAKSKRDDSNAPGGCRGNDCPPAAAALRDEARAAGDAATIAFVAGGVLVATGVTLWLVAPRYARSPSVAVVPTALGAGVRGAF